MNASRKLVPCILGTLLGFTAALPAFGDGGTDPEVSPQLQSQKQLVSVRS